MKFENLAGQKFGRWSVIERAYKPNDKNTYFLCRCECGTEKLVSAPRLKSGESKSCGCYKADREATHPQKENLVGKKYGRLLVISELPSRVTPSGQTQSMFKCRCDCGKEIAVKAGALKSGNTKSCGCLRLEKTLNRSTKHGGAANGSKERLYGVWRSMIQRCLADPHYAGRGISVCDEWQDYGNFRKWAYDNGYQADAERYACTIDRINNDGNYEPSNCRWVDMPTQMRNKRSNHLLTFNGETKTISDWAEQIGISFSTLESRIMSGWDVELALTTPCLPNNRYGHNYRHNK